MESFGWLRRGTLVIADLPTPVDKEVSLFLGMQNLSLLQCVLVQQLSRLYLSVCESLNVEVAACQNWRLGG